MNHLNAIRDSRISTADLARMLNVSETFAAGAVDEIDGGVDWADVMRHEDISPKPAEIDDYREGRNYARDLVEQEAIDEGWAECYALEAMRVAALVEVLPVASGEVVPW